MRRALPDARQPATAPDSTAPTWVALQDAPWLQPGVSLLAYCRSSTDEQDRSCPQQVRDIAHLWGEHRESREAAPLPERHTPARGVYIDEGYSGWKTTLDERPAGAALLAYCRANPQPRDTPGTITLWALSRLGRFPDGPIQAFHCLYDFHRLGWSFWSVSEGSLDCTDDDRLLKVLRIALHSEKDTASSEDKARGVVRGKRELRERGLWQGSFPPFGYDRWAARVVGERVEEWIEQLAVGKRNGFTASDVHTVLRPNGDAAHVRQIYAWAAEGEQGRRLSLAEICARMNLTTARPYIARRGVPHGKAWYLSTVSRVLSNEAYLGVQRDRDGREYAARWEALVERSTWRTVRERLADNAARPRAVNTAYALTGLLVCAACGARYGGETQPNRADGIAYYRTGRIPGKVPCQRCRTRLRADLVEPAVVAAVAAIADDPVVVRAVAVEEEARSGRRSRTSDRRQTLTRDRDHAQAEVTRLLDLAGLGGEVARQARARIDRANHDVARLTGVLDQLDAGRASGAGDAAATVASLQRQARDFGALYRDASMEERKTLLRCFVVRLDVDAPAESLLVHYRRPAAVDL